MGQQQPVRALEAGRQRVDVLVRADRPAIQPRDVRAGGQGLARLRAPRPARPARVADLVHRVRVATDPADVEPEGAVGARQDADAQHAVDARLPEQRVVEIGGARAHARLQQRLEIDDHRMLARGQEVLEVHVGGAQGVQHCELAAEPFEVARDGRGVGAVRRGDDGLPAAIGAGGERARAMKGRCEAASREVRQQRVVRDVRRQRARLVHHAVARRERRSSAPDGSRRGGRPSPLSRRSPRRRRPAPAARPPPAGPPRDDRARGRSRRPTTPAGRPPSGRRTGSPRAALASGRGPRTGRRCARARSSASSAGQPSTRRVTSKSSASARRQMPAIPSPTVSASSATASARARGCACSASRAAATNAAPIRRPADSTAVAPRGRAAPASGAAAIARSTCLSHGGRAASGSGVPDSAASSVATSPSRSRVTRSSSPSGSDWLQRSRLRAGPSAGPAGLSETRSARGRASVQRRSASIVSWSPSPIAVKPPSAPPSASLQPGRSLVERSRLPIRGIGNNHCHPHDLPDTDSLAQAPSDEGRCR